MKRLELTCVAPIFPTPWFPESGVFLKNLADVMGDQDTTLQVIAPLSLGMQMRERSRGGAVKTVISQNYAVVRPQYLALPLRWCAENGFARRLNLMLFRRCVERGLLICPLPVRVVYGHFWVGGYAVQRWCKSRSIPFFVELQESGLRGLFDGRSEARAGRVFCDSEGIVCVSRENERFLGDIELPARVKVKYLPNGFDARRFFPMDRTECRRRLGLPLSGRIVVFAGHFIERKGPLRVVAALSRLKDAKGVFLGRGPQWPAGDRVLHAGPVLNSELPIWLSAGDLFVLPSLEEGLANVIVEAMACGLPLVVSDRLFNRDFLSENDAVFVDPESVSAISCGLASVLGSESRRAALAKAALSKSIAFCLQKRAAEIKAFVLDQIQRTL